MENALKIVLLAVAAIIVAVLIVAAFSLVNSGQSLLSTGKSQINNSLSDYAEVAYTQYDGAVIAGSQVISAIKNDWHEDNTVGVGVMTKDGASVYYDYSGNQIASIKLTSSGDEDSELQADSFPTINAKGRDFTAVGDSAIGSAVSKTMTNWAGVTASGDGGTISAKDSEFKLGTATTGYNSGVSPNETGYINPKSNFKGSIQRDYNGNIRSVIFVQQN